MRMTVAEAVRRFGSKRRIAKLLGISPQAVSYWGRFVPKLREYELAGMASAEPPIPPASTAESGGDEPEAPPNTPL